MFVRRAKVIGVVLRCHGIISGGLLLAVLEMAAGRNRVDVREHVHELGKVALGRFRALVAAGRARHVAADHGKVCDGVLLVIGARHVVGVFLDQFLATATQAGVCHLNVAKRPLRRRLAVSLARLGRIEVGHVMDELHKVLRDDVITVGLHRWR